MSIKKLPSGNWQAKLQDDSLNWISKTFSKKREAEAFDAMLKQQKYQGTLIQGSARQITLDEFFLTWSQQRGGVSHGWQKEQTQRYERDISPIIGSMKLHQIRKIQISRVLGKVSEDGKSSQTQIHVFNLLRKMFGDAVEIHEVLPFNPVIKALKPQLEEKETVHLNLNQAVKLLRHVKEKHYDAAIWLQLFLGLRAAEVIALQWDDLDLEVGVAHIRNSYSRKNVWATKDKSSGIKTPKGKRQLSLPIPPELLEFLREKKKASTSAWVAPSPFSEEMLSYEFYLETLKSYCQELNLPKIGTHGLRHSTAEIIQSNGATNDIVGRMLRHSSSDMTQRYIHTDSNLMKLVSNLNILSAKTTTK